MPYDALTHAAQIGLNSLGYKLKEDGLDGPATQGALGDWQFKLQPPVGDQSIDARTLKNIATLEPKAQAVFKAFVVEAKKEAAKFGCDYIGISGNRTFKEQDELYAQGRTKPGPIITKARAGQSNHNFGIAMDFGVFSAGKYLDDSEPTTAAKVHKAVAKLADKFNLEWGGGWTTFVDLPHYEVKTNLSMAQKRERILSGQPVLV